MKTYGAAIYLHLTDEAKIKEYVKLLAKYNFKIIFTTLIMFQPKDKANWDKLHVLTTAAKENNIAVYADVNGKFFYDYQLNYKKPKEIIKWFWQLGLSGIRCDDNIPLSLQAKLSTNNDFKVLINGTKNMLELEQLILGHNINQNNTISCYNFYPQRYTGASVDFYLLNQYESHINNIAFAGFVSLQGKKYVGPWLYNDNLPSLEIYRDWDLITQIQHLIAIGTDIIIVANQFLTEQDLVAISKITTEKVSIKVTLDSKITDNEKQILLDENIHTVRGDLAQDVIRSNQPISVYQTLNIKPKVQKAIFEIGDVIILNDDAKNYCRELQIVVKPIKNDGIRNLVAQIDEPYLSYFLNELKANRPFKFIFE